MKVIKWKFYMLQSICFDFLKDLKELEPEAYKNLKSFPTHSPEYHYTFYGFTELMEDSLVFLKVKYG